MSEVRSAGMKSIARERDREIVKPYRESQRADDIIQQVLLAVVSCRNPEETQIIRLLIPVLHYRVSDQVK